VFTAPKGGWEYPAFLTLAAVVVGLLGQGSYGFGLRQTESRADRNGLQRAA
jgi:hypothetical protein